MKIAVVGANGRVGRLIVKEAIDRGIDVTAIVRTKNNTSTNSVIIKDLYDLTSHDLRDFNVIIDAFGIWQEESFNQHSTSLMHLCDIVNNKQRLLVVGGAGSLYLDSSHTKRVMDDEQFPEMFKPLAQSMGDALDKLRNRNDVSWTYISPASDFQAEGQRKAKYLLAGEEIRFNDNGDSYISYADYAIALIDEVINNKHHQARISVLGV